MVFKIRNKIALVTGGVSGIGLSLVKELLKNGAKGVTLADINLENAEKIVKELNQKYGPKKVVYVKTDVSDSKSFENAFKVTLDNFKNVDILCNNAGVCNEVSWERSIDINLKGTINGIVLAQENYIKNHKQEAEGIIINTSSLTSFVPAPPIPTYTATKFAVLGLTKCWGHPMYFRRSGVRVVAILPSMTDTTIFSASSNKTKPKDKKPFDKIFDAMRSTIQSPDFVGEETMKIIENAENGSAWVIEETKPAYEYVLPEKNVFENNILKLKL